MHIKKRIYKNLASEYVVMDLTPIGIYQNRSNRLMEYFLVIYFVARKTVEKVSSFEGDNENSQRVHVNFSADTITKYHRTVQRH